MSPKIPSEARQKAYKQQTGRCYYCGCPMWTNNDIEKFAKKYSISTEQAKKLQCTAEHLVARCDGGSNEQSNIVAACYFCNQNRHKQKKPPVPLEYKKHVKNRIKTGKWFDQALRIRMSL